MASRDRDDTPPVVPLRPVDGRRSRIAQARGYHPRAHTVGDNPRGDTEDDPRPAPSRSRTSEARSSARTSEARSTSRTGEARSTSRTGEARGSARTGEGRAEGDRPALRLVADGRTGARRTTQHRGTGRTASTRTVPPTRTAPARRTRRVRFAERGDGSVVAPKLADQSRRLRASLSIVLVLLLLIAVRLVQFQFSDGAAYAALGLESRTQPVDLPAPRGNITDRDGAILAGSAEARYVFTDPKLVKDAGRTADVLSPMLGVPRSELLPKLAPHTYTNGKESEFEYLARGVAVDVGDRVSALNLPGIGVRRDESRVVPGHDLAANLIGFTGEDMKGLTGLEASYDDVLKGVDGERKFEIGQGAGGIDLDQEIPGGYHEETPARPGSTVQLTIDRDLQYEIQRILGVRMTAARATVGAAVVLDVRTGEVLAQASYPFYNAADPSTSKESDWTDNASGWAVEPGSVHKGIVFAACLQTGVVKPGDTELVGPSVTKGDTTFRDTHVNTTPKLMTLPGILALSSNVGTIGLADKLGAQNLYDYQRAFGLGQLTNEGLPGESPGLVQPPQNWSDTSYGSIPIGHGVSVTPLQMAAVYATIANGGVYVQPHLVKAVVAPDGVATPSKPAPTHQVISAENATALRNMLEAVTTAPNATGLEAAVPNYRVSGKTGTGTMYQNGKVVDGDVASFIGMAPADAPRYVIAVFAHTPPAGGDRELASAAVASPAFSEMMSYTLRHFKVAPTGAKAQTFAEYG